MIAKIFPTDKTTYNELMWHIWSDYDDKNRHVENNFNEVAFKHRHKPINKENIVKYLGWHHCKSDHYYNNVLKLEMAILEFDGARFISIYSTKTSDNFYDYIPMPENMYGLYFLLSLIRGYDFTVTNSNYIYSEKDKCFVANFPKRQNQSAPVERTLNSETSITGQLRS